MSKYDLAINAIKKITNTNEIGDNDEGIISVYDLCQLANQFFKPFFDGFSSIERKRNLAPILSAAAVYKSHFEAPWIYFNYNFLDDLYNISIKYESMTMKRDIQFYQDKGCDSYCYDPTWFLDKTKMFPNFDQAIVPLFKLMSQYDAYDNFLNSLNMNDSNNVKHADFSHFDLAGNIISNSSGEFRCNLYFSEINSVYMRLLWNDGRTPLDKIMEENKDIIAKRIPIDVNSLSEDNILRMIYFDSKSLDNTRQKVIKKEYSK